MKLIATLAALAALVGQTEAAVSEIRVAKVVVGNAPCTDKVTITAKMGAALTNADKFHFSSTKLTTKTVAQVLTAGVATTACNSAAGPADADATNANVFGAAPTYADGKWTFTTGSNGCTAPTAAATAVRITLDNVCNNGVIDYNVIGLKGGLGTADMVDTDQTASANNIGTSEGMPAKLAEFTITKMPLVKATTGEFEATFTGVAGLNNKKLVLNLPKDYTIPAGAKCSIKKKADTTAKIITAASDGGLGSECSDTCVFSVALPNAAGAGFMDGTEATFFCDKVKSGAALPDNAVDAVAIKVHTTSNENLYAGYGKFLTPSPTAAPKKAADSPASVATASGVVVGALGVAALFLA